MSPDRAGLAAVLVGLLALAGTLVPGKGVAGRVVHLPDAPRPGWYEADDLAAAAREAGAEAPALANGTIADGATVRLKGGWALVDSAPQATRVFGGRLSLNRASQAELEGLPGVGPALAARIVAGRPYTRLADLDAVKGIGPKKLAALGPLVEP